MFRRIRNSGFIRILWGFMGLYLLNISVDTADANPEHIAEDLTINDQESLIEIIVEKILGFEDAFAEYDDPDSEDHDKKNKIDLIVLLSVEQTGSKNPFETISRAYPDHRAFLTNGYCQLHTPPPKI
ncbi:hypothetical protein [Ulvibacterium marinum]|uniref:Uncharacterized protein n=1 Tax=Ulvibacterium marinum TaxID=2419782 RepID=A0A3B0C1M0_9FLAO|nr:hypothetical protein [Ulvibacterium marinum]RKN79683.1 hypothetical protein D7Z94_15430 [Ulvibacterium marinum]